MNRPTSGRQWAIQIISYRYPTIRTNDPAKAALFQRFHFKVLQVYHAKNIEPIVMQTDPARYGKRRNSQKKHWLFTKRRCGFERFAISGMREIVR